MPIGESIKQSVINAIEARESLVKSESKTKDTLKFTHGRTSFAVVRSLVKVGGTRDAAKSAVLTGGLFTDDEKLRVGIDKTANKNFSNSDSAYYQSSIFGFRPMPGITNINSSVRGGEGAIRETVISFTANTSEDLELLSKVYFHFGAHIVIEFGHSVYIDSGNNIKALGLGDTISWDDIEGKSLSQIEKKLDSLADTKNYHYEGLIGHVINFDFQITELGSFNCTLKVISDNGVLDSLKLPSVVDKISNFKLQEEDGENEAPKNTDEITNLIGLICSRLSNAEIDESGRFSIKTLLKDPNVLLGNVADKLSNDYTAYCGKSFVYDIDENGESFLSSEELIVHLPIRFWMEILNEFSMPKNSRGKLVRIDLDGNAYRRFYSVFSLNPGMVQLPFDSNIKFAKVKHEGGTFGEGFDGISDIQQQNILDIHISTALVSKVNNSFVGLNPDSQDEVGITDFITMIMQEVQKYMGDLNTFVVAVDPDDREIEIYDKGFPNKAGNMLNLTGLSTTVSALSIQSKLSGNIQTAAMFSGAGSGAKGGKKETNLAELNKRSDAKDDLSSVSTYVYSNPDEADNNIGDADVEKLITESYEQFSLSGMNDFDSKLETYSDYMVSKISGGRKASGKYMPIPVDVSITMLGIGGIKNLQTFRIPDHVVPKKFGNTNFIVMNVEHALDSSTSQWETTITGMLKPN